MIHDSTRWTSRCGCIALAILLLGFIGPTPTWAAPEPKVQICHLGDEGPKVINVSQNATNAHLGHGDCQLPACDLNGFDVFQTGDECNNFVPNSEGHCTSSLNSFPQPETRCFFDDTFETELEAIMATNMIDGDMVETPTYNGNLFGPTFLVSPGDTLSLTKLNNLPANPAGQREGAFPHDPYTTNFHSHGLVVSPQGISDNVLRLMEPGSVNPIEIQLPDDHSCGTFWYHPHKHGSVAFQFFGGMAGFLIVKDSSCPLQGVPEIKAARDILMGFEVIRVDATTRTVPFVNQAAVQFSGTMVPGESLWQNFVGSDFYVLTNGVTNPILHMQPGEVARLRLLNAASGETLVIGLEGHDLHVIAQDGINTSEVFQVSDYVMGAGNRVDVMVKAGAAGTYLLEALDPSVPRSVSSIAGIAPAARNSRIGADFPVPGMSDFPVTLATIEVSGDPVIMNLPSGPLPAPSGLPSIADMLTLLPDETRNISFEICSPMTQGTLDLALNNLCTFYFNEYDTAYWGDTPFTNLLMMRNADDMGPAFQEEGLFLETNAPLFAGVPMAVGTCEEWTILNRTASDHPFHIHQNPYLITHINTMALTDPEWRDTTLIPAASNPFGDPVGTAGSITYRTCFQEGTDGDFVAHCHILSHEDVGMMNLFRIAP